MELRFNNLSTEKINKVSVVMATLGGFSVERTIKSLNSGSIVPEEIIICIPEDCKRYVEKLQYENVRILITPYRGQVSQRVFGFQHVSNNLVLQLDDDIELRYDCLEKLVDYILTAENIAVAPKMFDVRTGHYHASHTPQLLTIPFFQNLIFWTVNGLDGYIPGKIGKSGVGMGLPEMPEDWSDIEWLPGGCVLHRKKNLILCDYYTFKGKAFAEDLFHSVLLRNKGVHLVRCGRARCDVDFLNEDSNNFFGILRGYFAYTITLQKFINDNGGNSIFLYMYLLLNLLNILLRKIFKLFNSISR